MWRMAVTIGDLALEAEGPTEPDPDNPPPLPALIGVTWTDTLAGDGALWPAQADISTGTVTILAETAAELVDVSSATPVAVEFYADTADTEPAAALYGRASDPSLAVHERGVLASIVVTDYLADLAELTAGEYDYPSEDHYTRLIRVFDDVGIELQVQDPTTGSWSPLAGSSDAATLAARTASATSVLAYTADVLAWAVSHTVSMVPIELHDWTMRELVAITDTAGALTGYGLRMLANLQSGNASGPTYKRSTPAPAPGELVEDGGVWGIVWPDTGDPLGPYVVDANDVSFSATWARRRDLDIDRVEVVKSDDSVRRDSLPDAVPITARVQTSLTSNADADDTLLMLLPDARPATHWQADKFTVHLDLAAAGYFPAPLRTLVTLHGLEPRHNPDNSPYWHGIVWARTTTAEAEEVTVELVLLPARDVGPMFDGVSGYYSVSFNELPAMAFEDMDPAIRWVDMYQVRG